MLPQLKRIAVTLTALITLLLGGTLSGIASASPSEIHRAVTNLAQTGRLSAEDRATLLRAPHIARSVVDPEKTEVKRDVRRADSPASYGPAASCWTGSDSVNGYTVLGYWAFTFTYRVDWCEEADVVLGVHYRQGSTKLSDFMEDKGVSENWVTPTPARNVDTKWKQHLQNCPLFLPCLRSSYPYVVWHLTADPFGTDWTERGVEG